MTILHDMPEPVKQGPFGEVYTGHQVREAIATLQARIEQQHVMFTKLNQHCAELECERDALKADGERLDFMAKKLCGASDSERYLPFRIYWGGGSGKSIRQAIDTARSKT